MPNTDGSNIALGTEDALVVTSYQNYDLVIIDGVAKLMKNGLVNNANWTGWLVAQPFTYEPGITELRLQRANGLEIVGTIVVNSADESELSVTVDAETLPDDTIISGPNADRTTIDYIIDPVRFDPRTIQDC